MAVNNPKDSFRHLFYSMTKLISYEQNRKSKTCCPVHYESYNPSNSPDTEFCQSHICQESKWPGDIK